jgi:hypothetical protein
MRTLDVEAAFSQTLNAIEAVMRLSKQFTGADAIGITSDDLCALMYGIRALLYREGAAYEVPTFSDDLFRQAAQAPDASA